MNKTTKEDNVEIAEKAKIDRPSFFSRALDFSFIVHGLVRPILSEVYCLIAEIDRDLGCKIGQ